jgi:hypothetical protein
VVSAAEPPRPLSNRLCISNYSLQLLITKVKNVLDRELHNVLSNLQVFVCEKYLKTCCVTFFHPLYGNERKLAMLIRVAHQ